MLDWEGNEHHDLPGTHGQPEREVTDTDKNSWEETLLPVSAASSHPVFLPSRFLASHQWLGINSSDRNWVQKTLGHCLFCEQKGAISVRQKAMKTRNEVGSEYQAHVTFQARGRRIGIPGLVGTQRPHGVYSLPKQISHGPIALRGTPALRKTVHLNSFAGGHTVGAQ